MQRYTPYFAELFCEALGGSVCGNRRWPSKTGRGISSLALLPYLPPFFCFASSFSFPKNWSKRSNMLSRFFGGSIGVPTVSRSLETSFFMAENS